MKYALVILESEAAFPGWIDDELGPSSDVVVLARRRLETLREFEARMASRLAAVPDGAEPCVSVLACGTAEGPEQEALCRTLLYALARLADRRDGARVFVTTSRMNPGMERVVDEARRTGRRTPVVRVESCHLDAASAPEVRLVA